MSLEQAIAANTAAIEALTAVMSKGGAAPAAAASGGRAKAADKPAAYVAQHTVEEMQTVMNEVREKCGKDVAVELRNTVGKVAKLSEVSDPKVVDALYDAAKAKLKDAEDAM